MFKSAERKRSQGFTLAEVLIVVAIIGILLAVAIPNVISYYRSLKLTELDDSAKTIFMAAQSRLTAMTSAGQKLKDDNTTGHQGAGKCGYDVGVTAGDPVPEVDFTYATFEHSDIQDLLPGGSIESQLRQNDYVIEYSPETGAVHAVWYWEKDTAFSYDDDYLESETAKSKRLEDNKMVGYYGGRGVVRPTVDQMPIPELSLTNAEELRLTIKIPTMDTSIVGISFDRTKIKVDVLVDGNPIVMGASLWDGGKTGTVVLDTLKSSYSVDKPTNGGSDWTVGSEFKNWTVYDSSGNPTSNPLITSVTPGGDITVTVKVYYEGDAQLAAGTGHLLSQSATVHTNSLFAGVEEDPVTGEPVTAKIAYGRHLQNLDSGTSGVITTVTAAEQTRSIDFNDSTSVTGVYSWAETYGTRQFTAIYNTSLTSYDGHSLPISNMDVKENILPYLGNETHAAGLFALVSGTSTNHATLKDITLINTKASAVHDVGALAGQVDYTDILECKVYLDYEPPVSNSPMITGTSRVGGLVGQVHAGDVKIEDSFASTVIEGNRDTGTGGLVGNVRSQVSKFEIINSYAACYISGPVAGGLIGAAEGSLSETVISDSYAAGIIEVARTTTNAAGISPQSGRPMSIKNSYAAVRYVKDAAAAPTIYGVAQSGTTMTDNVYYVTQTGITYATDSGEAVSMSGLKNKIGTAPFDVTNGWYDPGTGTAVNPQGLTYPYNILNEGLADPYPYPMLASDITAVGSTDTLPMPHYGDWLENSYATSFYWEREGTDYNFYLVLSDGGTTPYIASSLCQLHHLDGSAGQHIGENDWGYGLIGIDRADVPFSDITEDTTSDKSVFVTNLLAFLVDTSVSWNSKPESEELEDINALFGDTNNMILLKGAAEDKYTSISTDVGYFELNLGFAAAIDVTEAASPTPTNMGKNADNAYQIRTTWQLDSINSDSGLNTSWFNQTHDIVYETAGTPHTEIKNFAGHYDGGFFRILDIDSSLFMSLNGTARLEHIILYSPDGADISGHGGLAMSSGGSGVEIEKCIVAGFNFSEASGAVGGLVGEVTNGALSITDCEAVNELGATVSTGSTANVGGLVGNVSSGAELTITGSYAGGKIEAADDSAGGLVGASSGAVNYNGGVYSYVDMSDSAVTASAFYGIGPGTVSGGTARYWSGGLIGKTVSDTGNTAVPLSDLTITPPATQHTYIPDETGHDFAEGLKDQNIPIDPTDPSSNNPYPFTPVVNVPATVYGETGADIPVHYGSWPPDEPAAQSFCYYDVIDGIYGVWGYIAAPTTGALTPVNTLQTGTPNSGICATDDGYCIPVEQIGGTSTVPAAPTVSGITCTVDSTPIGTATVDTKTYDLYKVNGLENVSKTTYYNTITVGTTEYYFNPFFACEILTADPGAANINTPQAKRGTNSLDPQSLEADNYNGKVIIRTARQLANLVDQTGDKYQNTNAQNSDYVQLLDIDYDKYTGVNLKGKSDTNRQTPAALNNGSYNGNNFLIRNLYIGSDTATSTDGTGLFGDTKGALSNIRLVNVKVTGSRQNVGALVGRFQGTNTITNCGVYVDSASAPAGTDAYGTFMVSGSNARVGGLIGNINSEATIANCFAAVKVSGSNDVGGLIGNYAAQNDGTLINCYAGGHTDTGTYSSATAYVNVSTSGNRVGGLIGTVANSNSTITTLTFSGVCYSTCSVTAGSISTGDPKIGLLIGNLNEKTKVVTETSTLGAAKSVTYAVGTAFDKDGNVVTKPHDESDYLTTPTANLADILAATNGGTGATADKYDGTLGASYPYLTASGAEHHGDWPELQEAVFYWEQEGTEYNFYAKGYLNNQEVTLDTLCKEHHTVEQVEVVDTAAGTTSAGTNATSNDSWGYGLYGRTPTQAPVTPSGATTTTNSDAEAGLKKLLSLDDPNVGVTLLQGGTAGTLSTSAASHTYQLDPGFGAAIEVGTSSTMGQAGNPYQIRNVRQLDNILDGSYDPIASEYNFSEYQYKQSHDMYGKTYNDYKGAELFGGTYNGLGYRILELDVTPSNKRAGLFDSVSGANLVNIILYSPSGNAKITGSASSDNAAGGLVVAIDDTVGKTEITNCIVAGYNISLSGGSGEVGGLVGYITSSGDLEITRSAAVNNLDGANANVGVGGLLGDNNGKDVTIIGCYAGGKITNASSGNSGGIVGNLRSGSGSCSYTNVYSYVNMSDASNTTTSLYGIGPNGTSGTYTNCYYWSGGIPTGQTPMDESEAGVNPQTDLSDLQTCMNGAVDSPFSTPGTDTVQTYAPNSTGPYPYPAVVQKVTGYDAAGNPEYGDYVHYGDWPNP